MKRIEIFKVGTHRSMDGHEGTYSDRTLRLTAAAYDPEVYKAPICIGHPTTDAPAYGWVQGLEFTDGKLSAYVDDVDPSFAEAVREGRYRNVSASFWRPDAPTNPKAGVLSLRHVGFLGAVPPAVKGLRTASFSADGEGVVDFAASGGTVDSLDAEAARAAADAERKRVRSASGRAADMAAREAELTAREAAIERAVVAAFCDRLEGEGRLLPALRPLAETLLRSASTSETVLFSDGGAERSADQRAALMRFLELAPKVVEFGDVCRPEQEEDKPARFAAPQGYTVGAAGMDLLSRAEQLMARKNIPFAEAVRQAAEAAG